MVTQAKEEDYSKNEERTLSGIIIILLIFSLSILPIKIWAQFPDRELSWKNIQIDGNSGTVYSIFRDNKGIMWVGTDHGLYFYDGFATHPVGEDMIGLFQIYALDGKNDKLYIGTNNGLFSFDYKNGKVTEEKGNLPGEIRSLLINGEEVWIGSLHGIYCYKPDKGEATDLSESLPNKSIYSLLKDSRGILYVGTYNGLARWDSIGRDFQIVSKELGNEIKTNQFINTLIESEDGRSIYIGGENSLYRYTPATDRWEKPRDLSGVNVKSIAKGKDGHLIIGSDDGIFDLYNDTLKHYRHDSRQPQSIAHNEIWSLYSDEEGNIWAGHERGFSIASNSEIIKNYNLGQLTQKGEGNEINHFLRDRSNNLWMGGSNGLIKLSEEGEVEWFRHNKETNSLSHNRIRDILQTESGDIWLATDGGINRFDGNKSFRKYNVTDTSGRYDANWVYSLKESQGKLIIGSFLGGILGVDTLKLRKNYPDDKIIADISINSYTNPWIRNELVNQIAKDKANNIWVLLFRDNSLVKFNEEMEKEEDYNIYELTGEYPTHLIADGKGRIVCGFKGGILIFDEKGETRKVIFDSIGNDENILAMSVVDEDLWVSTRNNLWKIDGETFKASVLPVPQKGYTAVYQDPMSSKVLLGAADEIIEIEKDKLNYDKTYGKVKLIVEDKGDGIWHFSDERRELVLPYGGKIDLLVSTLYYSPEKVTRFMYKIAKNVTDTISGWRLLPEGSNRISLSDLRMGNYFVMIKCEGSQSVSVSLPLRVQAPAALSWWAISLYILCLCVIIIGIICYLNHKRKRDLEHQKRKTELQNVENKLKFLSSISHDLKTPLSLILGPVSLMKERIKDSEMKKNLDGVYHNAIHLSNMIHKAIELQHIEASDDSLLIMSRFNIVEHCKSIFEVFAENNPKRKFLFHSPSDKIYIEADAVKMESIVNNLLSNACKYSYEGSIITLGIIENNDDVMLSVADDGAGIAEKDQPLIFEKMYRSPETSRMNEGSGLGLYLIKRYIESMDGRINVYSRQGEGSTFTITLRKCGNAIIEKEKEPEMKTDAPKVLIVEDNKQISNLLYDILKEEYSVMTAENGRSGIAVAGAFMPDLIIADEMMPVMTGLQMTQRLKENPKLSTIPIIMLTAKNDNHTETESIKRGIDIFMRKPFDPVTLKVRVRQLIRRKKEMMEKGRVAAILENESRPIEAESVKEKNIANIIRIIEENIPDPDFNVEMLSEKSGLSNKNIYRLIKKYIDKPPLDFIRTVRLQKAASLLSQKQFTVSEICYMVGFKTPSYFTKCFHSLYGMTPSEYMEKDIEKREN